MQGNRAIFGRFKCRNMKLFKFFKTVTFVHSLKKQILFIKKNENQSLRKMCQSVKPFFPGCHELLLFVFYFLVQSYKKGRQGKINKLYYDISKHSNKKKN